MASYLLDGEAEVFGVNDSRKYMVEQSLKLLIGICIDNRGPNGLVEAPVFCTYQAEAGRSSDR